RLSSAIAFFYHFKRFSGVFKFKHHGCFSVNHYEAPLFYPMSSSDKKSISQQEAEAAELTAIINSMPDAVYIGDLSGIKRCNRVALEMLGFDSVEELNQNITILADRIKTRDAKTKKRLAADEEPFFR